MGRFSLVFNVEGDLARNRAFGCCECYGIIEQIGSSVGLSDERVTYLGGLISWIQANTKKPASVGLYTKTYV